MHIRRTIVILALSVSVASAAEAPPVPYATRAEVASLLVRIQSIPTMPYSSEYTDVRAGDWFAADVLTAAKMGLLTADPSGHVRPYQSVSRVEFLRMLAVSFKLEVNGPFLYLDIPPTAWYRPYVSVAYKYHLFQDSQDPLSLRPDLRITHAEAAAALSAILQAEPQLRPVQIVPRPLPALSGPEIVTRPEDVRMSVQMSLAENTHTGDRVRDDLVALVNVQRTKAGLYPLRLNTALSIAAQKHAEDMASRGYFSHVAPEGTTFVERIRNGGYMNIQEASCGCTPVFTIAGTEQFGTTQGPSQSTVRPLQQCSACEPMFSVGENIAKGQFSAEEVMTDWMNSEPHRKNILHPGFEEIGLGYYKDIWVQEFGRVRVVRKGPGPIAGQ